MYILLLIALAISGITLQEFLLRKVNTPLKSLILVLYSAILSIAGFLVIIFETLLNEPLLGIYLISFSLPAFFIVYLTNYFKFFKQPEFLGLLVVLFTVLSFASSVYVPSTLQTVTEDSPHLCDPSAYPFFIDLSNILQNSSYDSYKININLGQGTSEAYLVYGEFLLYLNESKEVQFLANQTISLLHNGDLKTANSSYSQMFREYNLMTSTLQSLIYNSNQLFDKLGGSSISTFSYDLNQFNSKVTSRVYYVEKIMSLIQNYSFKSYHPVSVHLSPTVLEFNNTVEINGNITSSYGSPNGSVVIYVNNISIQRSLNNGEFSFPLKLTQYVRALPITVEYLGNKGYLPNISSFYLPTNVVLTSMTFNVTPRGSIYLVKL